MSAKLVASVSPSSEFVLNVDAENIDPAYVTAARNGVVTVLLSQGWEPVLGCSVNLSGFESHESQSSYAAFYAVAKEAMEQLLGVAPGSKFNIAWGGENGA